LQWRRKLQAETREIGDFMDWITYKIKAAEELQRRKECTLIEYADKKYYIKWRPQPRQLKFLQACGLSYAYDGSDSKPQAAVIGYGGAAGGGKSDSLLAIAFLAAAKFPRCNIGYFRREYPQLEGPGGAIMRSQELLSGIAKWNGSQLRWTFPNGSILEFCHCKNENDVYNYQSQQFDIILLDEGTQFTRFIYRYLLTRNRATVSGLIPFMAIGTNPGNVGHVWFKDEFVDIGEPEQPHEVEVEPGVMETHIFIPAKLSDNKILEERDPNYRKKLEAQDKDTREMLLGGSFDVFAGRYFEEFKREIHVIDPFTIDPGWKIIRFLDYGLDKLACYWVAIDYQGKAKVYKEIWESDLIISAAAKRINEMTLPSEKIYQTLAPPDLWNRRQDTGKSAAQIFQENGIYLTMANNEREQGCLDLKEWLNPYETLDEQTGETIKTANLQITSNCVNAIRSFLNILKDEKNPNVYATEPHDLTHSIDAFRYFCAGRPYPPKMKVPKVPRESIFKTQNNARSDLDIW
jgi:phage terminase large subunit